MTEMTQAQYVSYSELIAGILSNAVTTAFTEVYSQGRGQVLSETQKNALALSAYERSYAMM